MAKKGKRKNKSNPLFKSLLLFVMLLISGALLSNVFAEVLETRTLMNEINQASDKNDSLNEKKKNLNTQKENLNDTEYLIRYARAKYLATKEDGEQVFRLPEDASNEASETNE